MTTHKHMGHMGLSIFASALILATLSISTPYALADDSEVMDAGPENIPQYGNFPKPDEPAQSGKNQQGQHQKGRDSNGWYQSGQNQGYWNQNSRSNRADNNNEPRASRFSRQGRAERGRDGGGDD